MPCDYLHLVVLRAFDVLVYSMVLEVLVLALEAVSVWSNLHTDLSKHNQHRLFPWFSDSPSHAPLLSSSF